MRRTMWGAGLIVSVGLLAATPAQAVDGDAINKAIDRGVAYLKAVQKDGLWGSLGPTALCAVTLLECDVLEDDPLILKAAGHIRTDSLTNTKTYDLSLAIIFLDRLGNFADEPLIDSLTSRVMGGQNGLGGWGYECPANSPEEVRRLTAEIAKGAELSTRPDKTLKKRRTLKDFAPEVAARLQRAIEGGSVSSPGGPDNSNTQFANLALWVGRRHGVPVDGALSRINDRCRAGQRPDGGWAYTNPLPGVGIPNDPTKPFGGAGSTPTMTCAGILGLMTAHGVAADQKGNRTAWVIDGDPNLKRALAAISVVVGDPTGKKEDIPQIGGKTYYFLWSLERICVGMDLKTLGKKDWYAWGAEILLANQLGDGAWRGFYAGENADTCFALLFLKRANLVRDLTAGIKGRIKDTGERKLESGRRPKQLLPGLDPIDAKPGPQDGAGAKRPAGGDRPPEPRPSDPPPKSDPPKTTPPGDDSASGRLANELVKATADNQEEMLTRLRDGKGVDYTNALITAIAHLDGERKDQVRDALAKRLARMKAETLQRYLKDEEAEVRRAAATACATRELKTHIPDIIALLRDRSPVVVTAAHAALKSLSGENLAADAAAWETWWKTQK